MTIKTVTQLSICEKYLCALSTVKKIIVYYHNSWLLCTTKIISENKDKT